MTEIEDLLDKARKLKDDENFDEALKISENLILNYPENETIKKFHIDLLFAYGYHLNDQYIEGYERATEIFGKIIEIEPENYRAIYNKGIAFFYMEEMEQALKFFSRAIELKPDYKFPYYNMGLIYESIGNFHEALSYYDKALEIDPNFLYALHAKDDVKKQIRLLNIPKPEPKIDISKLKEIIEVSKRVRISLIQEILNLKPNDIDVILDWCKKFQFEIDGDFLIINKDNVPELIKSLESIYF